MKCSTLDRVLCGIHPFLDRSSKLELFFPQIFDEMVKEDLFVCLLGKIIVLETVL